MDINSLLMASTSSVELPNLSAVKASDAPLANFEKILQQHLPELSTQSDPTELAGLLQLGSPQLITLLPADHTLALPALEIPVETPIANLLEAQSLPLAPDVNSNVEATTVEALAADPDVSETPVHAKEATAEVEIPLN